MGWKGKPALPNNNRSKEACRVHPRIGPDVCECTRVGQRQRPGAGRRRSADSADRPNELVVLQVVPVEHYERVVASADGSGCGKSNSVHFKREERFISGAREQAGLIVDRRE